MNRVSDAAVYPSEDEEIHTRYEYDALGNPIKVVSGLSSKTAGESEGQTVTYEYDALGRMTKTTTPDGLFETSDYDNLGRVILSTDKANRETEFTYDEFNNLLSKTTGTESVSYTYNLMGMPVTMTDSSGITNYAYNPFGELTTETKGNIIKSYTYDDLSRRTSLDISDGDSCIINQTYTYDALGRLLSTSSGDDTVSYTYDANSNILTKSYNNNVYHTSVYNGANLPVITKVYTPTGTEYMTRYTYNPDGNLAISMGTDTNSMYYYDGAGRLVYENTWGDGIGYDDRFVYDSFGNRISRSYRDYYNNTTENTQYTYNNKNQLVSQTTGTDVTAYAYDTAGNMTHVICNGQITKAYTYDPFNRLSTANVNGIASSYTYNGNNLRQSKTVNGVTTNHIYDGANIVADLGEQDTVFVRGLDLALLKNGTTTQVYGITPRGDVSKLMSQDGTVTDYKYTAYGEPAEANTSLYNPFGYTGEYTDAETGLVYLRNRYYDPQIGRFLTEDTYWNVDNMIYGDKEYPNVVIATDLNEEERVEYLNKLFGFSSKSSKNEIIDKKDVLTSKYILRFNVGKTVCLYSNDDFDYADTYCYDAVKVPNVNSIGQSNNLYNYCTCNPLMFVDHDGNSMLGGITVTGVVKWLAKKAVIKIIANFILDQFDDGTVYAPSPEEAKRLKNK